MGFRAAVLFLSDGISDLCIKQRNKSTEININLEKQVNKVWLFFLCKLIVNKNKKKLTNAPEERKNSNVYFSYNKNTQTNFSYIRFKGVKT